MSQDLGTLNLHWANILIDQLFQQGITYFCLGPGSRSTPLALAIAEHPQTEHLVHFDERGLAFHALGYAKASQRSVALIATSGTAVANFLPAVMEASQERIPLILLTADRPHELRHCGANQACDQVKLFSNYVRWEVDLPCPTSEISERYLATTVAQAVFRAERGNPGPVHLNCPFREPLFSLSQPPFQEVVPTVYETTQTLPDMSALERWAEHFQEISQGEIVLGSLPSGQPMEPIFHLASLLKWPILPDLLSQARSEGTHPSLIPYYDPLLKTRKDFRPKLVLHLGDRLISKTLSEWLKSLNCPYFHVSNHPCRQDPDHMVTHRLAVDPSLFCREIACFVEERSPTTWLTCWKQAAEEIGQQLTAKLETQPDLTEPGIALSLARHLNTSHSLFFSNSMPIREADQLLFPHQAIGPIFANRGVSGIDGNLATAIGIAQAKKQTTIAVVGDLAFLHDINSLAQIRQAQYPVIFLVINNHGGAIFSLMPIAQRKDVLEEFFVASHPYDFQSAAELFQLPYFRSHQPQDWEQLLADLLANPCSAIVEVQTRRADNLHLHQELQQCLTPSSPMPGLLSSSFTAS
jgi:2-succinyl-5-enolpyruvyl-6-hydroxy-3-cyclohexene-1-carboxylate synthase